MLSLHITTTAVSASEEGQPCDSAAEISRDQFEYQMEFLQRYEILLRVSNSLRSRQQEPFIAQIKFTGVGSKSLAYFQGDWICCDTGFPSEHIATLYIILQ